MSYCGFICALMADTGVVEILSVAFGGEWGGLKMLSGKKYPQNVRALRMLVEEILVSVFEKHQLESMLDLQNILDDISSKIQNSKILRKLLDK